MARSLPNGRQGIQKFEVLYMCEDSDSDSDSESVPGQKIKPEQKTELNAEQKFDHLQKHESKQDPVP